MAPDSGIGASVLRLEDRRFLTGRGGLRIDSCGGVFWGIGK